MFLWGEYLKVHFFFSIYIFGFCFYVGFGCPLMGVEQTCLKRKNGSFGKLRPSDSVKDRFLSWVFLI